MFIRDLAECKQFYYYCVKNDRIVACDSTEDIKILISCNEETIYLSLYFVNNFNFYFSIEVDKSTRIHNAYFLLEENVDGEELHLFPNLISKINKFIADTLVNYNEDEYVIIFKNIFRILVVFIDVVDNIEVNPPIMKSARKTSN
jgi:hypothetical protein